MMTKRQPPSDLINTDLAVKGYGDAGTRWLDGMWEADPLADAVVADTYVTGSATEAVIAALSGGLEAVPDAPDSLRELFAFLDDEPDWVDHAAMARACDTLIEHAAAFALVLGAASLLRGAINSVAGKPLAQTGRYVSQPAVRSVEVGEWLRRVTTPGGMRRDGEGFAYTVRVRIIHAHVRRGLQRAGHWDEARWGVPIPQPFMAFTMAEFGHIALDAMWHLGVRFTDDDLADVYHLWRYVGHVLGMDDQFNPHDEADHRRIEELYELTSPGPSPDDLAFVNALTNDYLVPELADLLPGPNRWTKPPAVALIRALQNVFLGRDIAEELHIPPSRLTPIVRRANPLMAAVGRIRPIVMGGRRRMIRRAYRQRDLDVDRMRTDYGVNHQLVDDAPALT